MLKFSNLGLARGMALKFYTSVAKGLKLKARILTFAEVTEEKLVGGGFLACSPPWIGLKASFMYSFSTSLHQIHGFLLPNLRFCEKLILQVNYCFHEMVHKFWIFLISHILYFTTYEGFSRATNKDLKGYEIIKGQ